MSYAICEQQRRRSACASAQSDQRLCCSLARQNETSSLYFRNFKILAGLCSWAGQFVSCLVGDSRRHIFSWRGSVTMRFVMAAPCHFKTYLLAKGSFGWLSFSRAYAKLFVCTKIMTSFWELCVNMPDLILSLFLLLKQNFGYTTFFAHEVIIF